jgi:hypothetical protein
LAKPNAWLQNSNSPVHQALLKGFEICSRVLIQQYEARKKTEGANFKHRNWFRDPETLVEIRKGVELALEFGVAPRLSL